MKRSIFQNILWALPAETAHKLRMSGLRFVGKLPLGKWWIRVCHAPHSKHKFDCEVFGIRFRNPIGIGAGFDPDGDTIDELAAAGFSFVEIGSVLPRAQFGTPRPRIERLRSAESIIDNSGYPSKGMEYVLSNVRKRSKHTRNLVIGCNIGKLTTTQRSDAAKEYLRVFRNMYQYVDYFTINIACNTAAKSFVLSDRDSITHLIEPLFEFRRGQADYRPILLKISPDLSQSQIDEIIDVLITTPLDGLVAVAGSSDMTPDASGAISGALLTDRAIEVVRYIHQKTEGNYPIIGSGGMMNPSDIMRMLDAGASLVALNMGIRENGLRLLRKTTKAMYLASQQALAAEAQHTTTAGDAPTAEVPQDATNNS